MLFLPMLREPNTLLLPSIIGATFRMISPSKGSIFNTLAPRSANNLVQNAPEIIPVKSNMYKSDKLLFVGFVIIVGLMNFT